MRLRVLNTGHRSAAFNMGLDESLMESSARLGENEGILRLFGWNPPAISIGYFQSLEQEVDVDRCRELGVDVVRRMTGGGAVFHDSELTYSFFCREENSLVPRDILESYRVICSGVVRALESVGIGATFAGINDIIVSKNKRKISGNAQTRRKGVVLQHGTILLDVDVERMFSLLRVPEEKMRDKLVSTVRNRVTSVSDELGCEIGFSEFSKYVVDGFRDSFGAEIEMDEPSAEELEMAGRLAETKFGSREWNFRR